MMKIKTLADRPDTRGYFRELVRASDDFFDGFGQLSMSYMYTGTIKAWHYHRKQTDYWMCIQGVILAAVCEFGDTMYPGDDKHVEEVVMGDNYPSQVVKIPPMHFHGLKVLQGPAILLYITSHEYNPDDEGRIPFDALDYDWLKQDIR